MSLNLEDYYLDCGGKVNWRVYLDIANVKSHISADDQLKNVPDWLNRKKKIILNWIRWTEACHKLKF